MDLSPKRILKILKENGWVLDRIKGSHHIFVKGDESVPVPIHGNQDLKKGTFFAILKAIGVAKTEIGKFRTVQTDASLDDKITQVELSPEYRAMHDKFIEGLTIAGKSTILPKQSRTVRWYDTAQQETITQKAQIEFLQAEIARLREGNNEGNEDGSIKPLLLCMGSPVRLCVSINTLCSFDGAW